VSFEAALLGYPSVAFSIDVDEQQFFNESATLPGLEIAAEIASDITYKIYKKGLPKGVAFLNVNFPENVTKETPIEICQMAMTKYRDYTIRREDPRGVPYYWIWGDTLDLPKNTDSYAVLKRKIISITPITLFFDGRKIPNIKTELNFLKRIN
jgi:5'-nucleotidase